MSDTRRARIAAMVRRAIRFSVTCVHAAKYLPTVRRAVPRSAKFEYYLDRAGQWRWHLRAPNGEIIADSGQGYNSRQDCLYGIHLVQLYASGAEVKPG